MDDSPRLRLVLFRVGPHLSAALATTVREVIAAGHPTRIPGADLAVAGLLNVRGSLLTVVDGRRALGVADTTRDGASVLILEHAGRAYGLEVDEVLDLIEIPAGDLSTGQGPPGLDRRLVQSVGRHGGRLFSVLNTEQVLAPAFG